MKDNLTKPKNSFLFCFVIDIFTLSVRKNWSKDKSGFTTTEAFRKLLHKWNKKDQVWFDGIKKNFNKVLSEHFKHQPFHFYLNHADLKNVFRTTQLRCVIGLKEGTNVYSR